MKQGNSNSAGFMDVLYSSRVISSYMNTRPTVISSTYVSLTLRHNDMPPLIIINTHVPGSQKYSKIRSVPVSQSYMNYLFCLQCIRLVAKVQPPRGEAYSWPTVISLDLFRNRWIVYLSPLSSSMVILVDVWYLPLCLHPHQ